MTLGPMSWLVRLARRGVMRFLGLPSGSGILFGTQTRIRLGLAVAGSFAIALLEVLALALMVPFMQLVTGGQLPAGVSSALAQIGVVTRSQQAISLVMTVFGLYVLKAGVTVAFRWWFMGVMMREQVKTAEHLFDYYLRAPYKLHLQRTTADLLSTLNDGVGQVYGLVVVGSLTSLTALLSMVAVAVTLLIIMPVPSIVMFGYFALAASLFQWWARPRLAHASAEALEAAQGIFKYGIEALGTVKEVLVAESDAYYVKRYVGMKTRAAEAARLSGFLGELPRHMMEILFVLNIGIMTITAFTSSSTPDAVATIGLFAVGGFRILPNIVGLIAALNGIRGGQAGLAKVMQDVEAANQLPPPPARPVPPLPFTREITLEDVAFRYSSGRPAVLRGVSLTIPFGTSCAFVGNSGAGKTTLVDVILGLLEPNTGTVRCDGVDVQDDIHGWHAIVGMVPQAVWPHEGTIRENVAFSQDAIDDERVLEALKAADLAETVEELGGIYAGIGERGITMSGGQRQRMGIARALYARPKVLLLDEATSALDNESERRITDTINRLNGQMTVIVVAHRLSTIRHCDQIVYLENGLISAAGTFDEFRVAHAGFGRLVELGRLV